MEPLRIKRPPLPTARSEALMQRALHLFPGGVNNPPRALRALGEVPRFMVRAEGATLYDADQNRYLDLSMAGGPIILGHAAPRVNEAITRAVLRGSTFNAPCEEELLLGERVSRWVPSIEKLRFTHSEGEAFSAAIRLARAFTGRDGISRMEGHHHGDGDVVLRMSAGADAAGRDTWVLPWNDLEAARIFFQRHHAHVAALIVEPVPTSMGVVPPKTGYLRALRDLTREAGSLLIFDETVTGFRLGRGGAQEFYGVIADLTCLGKVLGGGLPSGAIGGRADVINMLAPQGPVHQAGLFAGNPPAMAAGLAVTEALEDEGAYAQLEAKGARLETGLQKAAAGTGVPMVVQRVGSMLSIHFTKMPVYNWSDVSHGDPRQFAAFARAMFARGIYMPPGLHESMFLSLAHTQEDLDRVCDMALEAMLEAMEI